MLTEIAIENLGVIPSASAELSPGLTVLTGETGAGKTMLVTGLRLLAGGRADASRIRNGAKKAVVEGRFLVSTAESSGTCRAVELAEEAGAVRDEGGEFIVSRTISAATGRSRAHLGGRSVPAATLQSFSNELLTIHGQNDQLRLLGAAEQLEALDRYNPATAKLRQSYSAAYRELQTYTEDLEARLSSRRELAQEIDRLQFAIKEIDDVSPIPGEEATLTDTIRRLQDVDFLREHSSAAVMAIDGSAALGLYESEEESAASTLLGEAKHALEKTDDPELLALAERLGVLTSELAEISGQLGVYFSDLPADAHALEEALQRQQALKSLTRKYAPDAQGVLEWRQKAQRRLESIDISSEAIDELKKKVAVAQKKVDDLGGKLTALRKKSAATLAQKVTAELHGLAMPKARLVVALQKKPAGRTGFDYVEFLLAPNDAAQPLPLASAASGGELSRVMLALEVILSSSSSGVTLVFDEVDAGVGGKAAVEIGRRLAKLARRNQVIVVTHLPQVAAYGDVHLHISKEVTDDSVTSGVNTLEGEERVAELARMLAGMEESATGVAHARELLQRARAEAAEFRK